MTKCDCGQYGATGHVTECPNHHYNRRAELLRVATAIYCGPWPGQRPSKGESVGEARGLISAVDAAVEEEA